MNKGHLRNDKNRPRKTLRVPAGSESRKPKAVRVWRKVRTLLQTPPGVIGVVIGLAGIAVSIHFGLANSSSPQPELEAKLDFALVSPEGDIDPLNSALVLNLVNRGTHPLQVKSISTDETSTFEPLPPAELNPKVNRYHVLHHWAGAVIGPEQGVSFEFATKTLLIFKPEALKIELATGEVIMVGLRRYIGVLRCAAVSKPRWCALVGYFASHHVSPVPRMLSDSGWPAIHYPSHRHIPAYCRHKSHFDGGNPHDQVCLKAFRVKVTVIPTPGQPIEWTASFP